MATDISFQLTYLGAELHEKAFRRLGGVTHIVVLDNLCEGVLVLHHGHVLKCGLRSWRTKIDLPE
jgi:hypothetical protein